MNLRQQRDERLGLWIAAIAITVTLWQCGADAHNKRVQEEQTKWHKQYQTQIETR